MTLYGQPSDLAGMVPGMPLSDHDQAVLDIARLHGGHRARAARERLGVDPTRYGQLLNRVLDDPGALEHDPVLVNRLRRLRDDGAARRARLRRTG